MKMTVIVYLPKVLYEEKSAETVNALRAIIVCYFYGMKLELLISKERRLKNITKNSIIIFIQKKIIVRNLQLS